MKERKKKGKVDETKRDRKKEREKPVSNKSIHGNNRRKDEEKKRNRL